MLVLEQFLSAFQRKKGGGEKDMDAV